MNPDWSSSSQTWETSTYTHGMPYELTWELRDQSTGATVVGPVDAPATTSGSGRNVVIDPQSHVDSLPDGNYDVVLTATVHKGPLSLSTSSTVIPAAAGMAYFFRVRLLNDPPPDQPQIRSAQRFIQMEARGEPQLAHFQTDAYADRKWWSEARVILTDSHGVDVTHYFPGPLQPCAVCVSSQMADFYVSPYGDNLNRLPSGEYTARLRLPDQWGRMMTLPLGKVYNQELVLRRSIVTRKPTKVRESRSRFVGSCARISTPDPAGITGSLWFRSQSWSRCSASAYYATTARQGLSVPLVKPANLERVSGVFVDYRGRATDSPSGRASAACLLPHKIAVWHDYPRLSQTRGWHRLCGRSYSGYAITDYWGPDRGDHVVARFEVAEGARLDLQRVRIRMTYLQWVTRA